VEQVVDVTVVDGGYRWPLSRERLGHDGAKRVGDRLSALLEVGGHGFRLRKVLAGLIRPAVPVV
jgi:hypothetical protein